jgi:hypothetical protein
MSNKMALDALTAIVEADDAQCLGQSHIEQARAAIAALQAEPQSQIDTMRLDASRLDSFHIPVYWEFLHDGKWRPEFYFNGKYAKGARGLYSDLQMHAMAQASARYLLAVDEFDHACHVDGDTPGGAPEQYDEAEGRLKAARAVLESAIKGFSA